MVSGIRSQVGFSSCAHEAASHWWFNSWLTRLLRMMTRLMQARAFILPNSLAAKAKLGDFPCRYSYS